MKNQHIANTVKDYLGAIVEKLSLFQWDEHSADLNSKTLEIINENVKKHSSCKKRKQHINKHNTCSCL